MSVPKVVIVGRPNVGKSSLFNWLVGKRISIVEPTAGVTRDRVEYLVHERDRYFDLVDTGGIGIVDSDDLSDDIDRQIQVGIDEASLILFVVDAKTGLVPLDLETARRLRGIKRPILIVANKCDSPKTDLEVAEFHKLGGHELITTSVRSNRGLDALFRAILNHLPDPDTEEDTEGATREADPELKLAIVGRRNVGKSTFINALAHTDRMIVSNIPGTTRDSVDVRFELDGKAFIAIDTPGVRKRKSLANDIEYYGLTRAKRSIRRADVVLMFFDASQTISMVDKQLVEEISDNYKPCIFVVNKWDLGLSEDMEANAWGDYLLEEFPTMRYVPVAFITAKEGINVKTLINLTQSVAKQSRIRVSTSKLNAVVRAAILANRPPMRATKQPRIYYATQVATEPPTIVLKCNFPQLIDKGWHRFLLGLIREKLPFPEVPIKLYFRQRSRKAAASPALDELTEHDAIAIHDDDEDDTSPAARDLPFDGGELPDEVLLNDRAIFSDLDDTSLDIAATEAGPTEQGGITILSPRNRPSSSPTSPTGFPGHRPQSDEDADEDMEEI